MTAADEDGTEPRTVSGWKATAGIIALILVVFLALNFLGERSASDQRQSPRPSPSVVTVSPSGDDG